MDSTTPFTTAFTPALIDGLDELGRLNGSFLASQRLLHWAASFGELAVLWMREDLRNALSALALLVLTGIGYMLYRLAQQVRGDGCVLSIGLV